jgi:hypothetical protein
VADLSPLEARYLDKAQETQASLWAALIAAESFLLAVAPVVSLVAPQRAAVLAVPLVVMSVLSIGLLIWNFVSTRNQYFKIGQIITERRPPSADDIPLSNRLNRQVRLRERLAIVLVGLQFLLILAISILVGYR